MGVVKKIGSRVFQLLAKEVWREVRQRLERVVLSLQLLAGRGEKDFETF